MIAFAPVGMIFAVIPFQNGALLADLNIGILYVVAISSVASGAMPRIDRLSCGNVLRVLCIDARRAVAAGRKQHGAADCREQPRRHATRITAIMPVV